MTYNWNRINLETYAAIDALIRMPTSDTIQRDITILSLLTGKPESYYEEINLTDLQAHIVEMRKFLAAQVPEALVKTIKCKGRTFYIGTNYDELSERQRRNLAGFTGANLVDYSVLKVTQENFAEKCPEIISILCTERTRMRRHLTHEQRVELFKKHVPASVGIGLALFFWAASNELLPILTSYLNETTAAIKKQA